VRIDYAERSRALLGTPFRAQGREAKTGLDCVGLAIVAFRVDAEQFRRDYRLRGDHRHELLAALREHFRRVSRRRRRPGDLLLLRVAPEQLHLAVQTRTGFVHADAGLGKVVETPGEPRWPVLAAFRRRVREARIA
jgi:murein DD-endopeptidase / murein LD-carboxypeptidase